MLTLPPFASLSRPCVESVNYQPPSCLPFCLVWQSRPAWKHSGLQVPASDSTLATTMLAYQTHRLSFVSLPVGKAWHIFHWSRIVPAKSSVKQEVGTHAAIHPPTPGCLAIHWSHCFLRWAGLVERSLIKYPAAVSPFMKNGTRANQSCSRNEAWRS